MDPKMRKLVDYLLGGYRTATLPPDPAEMPPMTADQLRVDHFVRGAPAHLPKAPKATPLTKRLAALLAPSGGRSGLATRMSMTPVED